MDCAGLELLGVAVDLPVPFPGPGAGATSPSVGRGEDPGAWFGFRLGWVAWVGRGVGDPLQNCCRWWGEMRGVGEACADGSDG